MTRGMLKKGNRKTSVITKIVCPIIMLAITLLMISYDCEKPSSGETITAKPAVSEARIAELKAPEKKVTESKPAEPQNDLHNTSSGSQEPDSCDYCVNVNRGGAAGREEKDVLIHLINAEAYGLSYKAKVAVGQVVMNRWKGPYYGNDLMAIMTAPHQFTPIWNGSAYKKDIESNSVKAANAVLNGVGIEELTDDTYYFVNPDFTEDKTIENTMEFVYETEGLHFFRPPCQ